MSALSPALRKLEQRLREEFDEDPDLAITVHQGARFWALDAESCERILMQLHEKGFLAKAADGRYRRSSGV